jgi:hypothetical protein
MLTNDSRDTESIATGWQIGGWRVEPTVNEICRNGNLRIEPKARK